MFSSRIAVPFRNIMTSAIRRGNEGGIPGSNLPFQIQNRYRLTAVMIIFFGSGFALPYLLVRHQLLKK